MSISPAHLSGDEPWERLIRLGAGALSDAELVGLIVGSDTTSIHPASAGRELITEHGGLHGLAMAFPEELMHSGGLGAEGAARLVASFELSSRARPRVAQVLDSPAVIADVSAPLLERERREKVLVLVADAANQLLRVVPIATGGVDHCPVPVREVLQTVLRYDGCAFALAHNHPSGDATPSLRDRQSTEAVRRAADAAGLRFLDHVVIAGHQWSSVR